MRKLWIIALLSLLVVAVSTGAAQRPATDVPLLVSTAWLAEHLKDPAVVVLWTIQGNRDEPQIAGARPVPHESVMSMAGGKHGLLGTEELVGVLERAGVSNSSHVVVYGEPTSAGWLFFALDYLGHDRISMLDGGIEKWRAEGRPVAVPSSAATRGSFKPAVRTRLNASSQQVQAQLGGRQAALLDARSKKEYDGGRIPGARLVPWQDVYADPKAQVFKSREALVAMFKDAGAAPGIPAITYCQLGLRSSVLYFAAKYAGLDVSNYVGSWAEWGALGLPAER